MTMPAGVAETLPLLLKVLVTGWVVGVAVSDHRSGRIPNWMTAPVMLGVGAFRMVQVLQGDWAKLGMLLAWVLIFALWMLHFMGGGDAKFLMALYALFPSMEFTAVLALVLLFITLPLMLMDLRHRPVGESAGSAWRRLATGQVLPTERELQERGRRYAWTFGIPALVYTWLYWGI